MADGNSHQVTTSENESQIFAAQLDRTPSFSSSTSALEIQSQSSTCVEEDTSSISAANDGSQQPRVELEHGQSIGELFIQNDTCSLNVDGPPAAVIDAAGSCSGADETTQTGETLSAGENTGNVPGDAHTAMEENSTTNDPSLSRAAVGIDDVVSSSVPGVDHSHGEDPSSLDLQTDVLSLFSSICNAEMVHSEEQNDTSNSTADQSVVPESSSTSAADWSSSNLTSHQPLTSGIRIRTDLMFNGESNGFFNMESCLDDEQSAEPAARDRCEVSDEAVLNLDSDRVLSVEPDSAAAAVAAEQSQLETTCISLSGVSAGGACSSTVSDWEEVVVEEEATEAALLARGFLTCSKCGNEIRVGGAPAWMLSDCLHTLCQSCMDAANTISASRGGLECALCETVSPEAVPHLLLEELLQLSDGDGGAAKRCGQCAERGADVAAVAHCADCATTLCAGCVNAHKVTKATWSHDMKKLANGDWCMDHNKVFDYSCESCSMMCCEECILSNHRSCNSSTLKFIMEKIDSNMSSQLDVLRPQKEEVTKQVAELRRKLCSGFEERDRGLKYINSQYEKYQRVMVTFFRAQAEMACKRHDDYIHHLQRHLAALGLITKRAEHMQHLITQLLKRGDTKTALHYVRPIADLSRRFQRVSLDGVNETPAPELTLRRVLGVDRVHDRMALLLYDAGVCVQQQQKHIVCVRFLQACGELLRRELGGQPTAAIGLIRALLNTIESLPRVPQPLMNLVHRLGARLLRCSMSSDGTVTARPAPAAASAVEQAVPATAPAAQAAASVVEEAAVQAATRPATASAPRPTAQAALLLQSNLAGVLAREPGRQDATRRQVRVPEVAVVQPVQKSVRTETAAEASDTQVLSGLLCSEPAAAAGSGAAQPGNPAETQQQQDTEAIIQSALAQHRPVLEQVLTQLQPGNGAQQGPSDQRAGNETGQNITTDDTGQLTCSQAEGQTKQKDVKTARDKRNELKEKMRKAKERWRRHVENVEHLKTSFRVEADFFQQQMEAKQREETHMASIKQHVNEQLASTRECLSQQQQATEQPIMQQASAQPNMPTQLASIHQQVNEQLANIKDYLNQQQQASEQPNVQQASRQSDTESTGLPQPADSSSHHQLPRQEQSNAPKPIMSGSSTQNRTLAPKPALGQVGPLVQLQSPPAQIISQVPNQILGPQAQVITQLQIPTLQLVSQPQIVASSPQAAQTQVITQLRSPPVHIVSQPQIVASSPQAAQTQVITQLRSPPVHIVSQPQLVAASPPVLGRTDVLPPAEAVSEPRLLVATQLLTRPQLVIGRPQPPPLLLASSPPVSSAAAAQQLAARALLVPVSSPTVVVASPAAAATPGHTTGFRFPIAKQRRPAAGQRATAAPSKGQSSTGSADGSNKNPSSVELGEVHVNISVDDAVRPRSDTSSGSAKSAAQHPLPFRLHDVFSGDQPAVGSKPSAPSSRTTAPRSGPPGSGEPPVQLSATPSGADKSADIVSMPIVLPDSDPESAPPAGDASPDAGNGDDEVPVIPPDSAPPSSNSEEDVPFIEVGEDDDPLALDDGSPFVQTKVEIVENEITERRAARKSVYADQAVTEIQKIPPSKRSAAPQPSPLESGSSPTEEGECEHPLDAAKSDDEDSHVLQRSRCDTLASSKGPRPEKEQSADAPPAASTFSGAASLDRSAGSSVIQYKPNSSRGPRAEAQSLETSSSNSHRSSNAQLPTISGRSGQAVASARRPKHIASTQDDRHRSSSALKRPHHDRGNQEQRDRVPPSHSQSGPAATAHKQTNPAAVDKTYASHASDSRKSSSRPAQKYADHHTRTDQRAGHVPGPSRQHTRLGLTPSNSCHVGPRVTSTIARPRAPPPQNARAKVLSRAHINILNKMKRMKSNVPFAGEPMRKRFRPAGPPTANAQRFGHSDPSLSTSPALSSDDRGAMHRAHTASTPSSAAHSSHAHPPPSGEERPRGLLPTPSGESVLRGLLPTPSGESVPRGLLPTPADESVFRGLLPTPHPPSQSATAELPIGAPSSAAPLRRPPSSGERQSSLRLDSAGRKVTRAGVAVETPMGDLLQSMLHTPEAQPDSPRPLEATATDEFILEHCAPSGRAQPRHASVDSVLMSIEEPAEELTSADITAALSRPPSAASSYHSGPVSRPASAEPAHEAGCPAAPPDGTRGEDRTGGKRRHSQTESDSQQQKRSADQHGDERRKDRDGHERDRRLHDGHRNKDIYEHNRNERRGQNSEKEGSKEKDKQCSQEHRSGGIVKRKEHTRKSGTSSKIDLKEKSKEKNPHGLQESSKNKGAADDQPLDKQTSGDDKPSGCGIKLVFNKGQSKWYKLKTVENEGKEQRSAGSVKDMSPSARLKVHGSTNMSGSSSKQVEESADQLKSFRLESRKAAGPSSSEPIPPQESEVAEEHHFDQTLSHDGNEDITQSESFARQQYSGPVLKKKSRQSLGLAAPTNNDDFDGDPTVVMEDLQLTSSSSSASPAPSSPGSPSDVEEPPEHDTSSSSSGSRAASALSNVSAPGADRDSPDSPAGPRKRIVSSSSDDSMPARRRQKPGSKSSSRVPSPADSPRPARQTVIASSSDSDSSDSGQSAPTADREPPAAPDSPSKQQHWSLTTTTATRPLHLVLPQGEPYLHTWDRRHDPLGIGFGQQVLWQPPPRGPASPNISYCKLCWDGGDLLLCDKCDRAFHKECYIGPMEDDENGEWRCAFCEPLPRLLAPGVWRRGGGRMNKADRRVARRLLMELYTAYYPCLYFRKRVNLEKIPEFKRIVNPVSLDEIRDRFLSGGFRSLMQLLEELKRLTAMVKYLKKGTAPYKYLKELFDVFDTFVREKMPKFWEQLDDS